MLTRRFPSALACIFSSLLAATAATGAVSAEARLRMAELEAGLAKQPDLYLVLEPAAKRLEVRARGLALATTEVREIDVLVFRPLFGGSGRTPPLEAPAVWRVEEGPGDTDRETIAPTTLRPYSEEEERTETPASKPGEEGEKPTTYRVALDNGWQLLLVDERPQLGWLRRFFAALRDGWLRLRGEEPSHPPLLALVVTAEDARRLHHLFRSGRRILVGPVE